MRKILAAVIIATFGWLVTDVVSAEKAEIIRYETRPENITEFKVNESVDLSTFNTRSIRTLSLSTLNTKSISTLSDTTLLDTTENTIFADWVGLLDRSDVQKIFQGGPVFHNIYSKNFPYTYDNILGESFSTVEKSHGYIHFILPHEINIDSAYFNASATTGNTIYFNFYDNNDKLVKESSIYYKSNGFTNIKLVVNAMNVKKIEVLSDTYVAMKEIEFDVLENYQAVENIEYSASDRTANLSWTLPTHEKLIGIKVNGKELGMAKNYTVRDLIPNKAQEVTVTAMYEQGVEIDSIIQVKTKPDITPPADVTNLKVTKLDTEKSKLTFTRPTDIDYSHAKISVNGTVRDDTTIDEYILSLASGKIYTFKVVAYDDQGNSSKGVEITLDLENKEVTNLNAKAKNFSEVTLSWDNPDRSEFEHVTIYRKNENGNIMQRMMRSFSAGDGYDPLFQTNGTAFKDLTVDANTTYEYKVTATVNNTESEGVKTTVKTPNLTVLDPETNTTANDYTFSWSAPDKGQMQVLIQGKLYTTVPAQDLTITIPKNAMKYDFLGNPDVKLVPVDPNGNAGSSVNPFNPPGGGNGNGSGGSGGNGNILSKIISAKDTLQAAVALFGVVGVFVLLGLAFRVVPKLVVIVRDAVHRKI